MRKIKVKKYQQGAGVSLYNPTMNLLPQFTPLNENIPMQIAAMTKPIDITPYFQAQNLFLARDKFEEDKRQFEIEKEFKKQDNDLRRIQITKTFTDDVSKIDVLAAHQEFLEERKKAIGVNQETMNKAYSGMEGLQESIGKFQSLLHDPQVNKLIFAKKAVTELLKQQENPQHLAMMSLEDQQRRLQDIQTMVDDPYGDHDLPALEISNYYNPEHKALGLEMAKLNKEKTELDMDLTRLRMETETEAKKKAISDNAVSFEANKAALEMYGIYNQYVGENIEPNMAASEIAEIHHNGQILAGIKQLPPNIVGLFTPTEWISMTPEERSAVMSKSISKSSTVSYSSIREDKRNAKKVYQTDSGQVVAVNPYMNSQESSKMEKGAMITIVGPDGREMTLDHHAYNKLFGGKTIKDRRIVKDGEVTKESIFGELGHPNFDQVRSFAIVDGEDGEQVLITNDPLVGQQLGLISAEELQDNPFNENSSWIGNNANPNWKYVFDETQQTGGHWEFKLGDPDPSRMREIVNNTLSTTNSNKPTSPVRTSTGGAGVNPSKGITALSRESNITYKNEDESSYMTGGNLTRVGSIPLNAVVTRVNGHAGAGIGITEQADISVTRGDGPEIRDFMLSEEGYIWSIITGARVLDEVEPGTDGIKEGEFISISGDRILRMGGRKSHSSSEHRWTAPHLDISKKEVSPEEIELLKDWMVEQGDIFELSSNNPNIKTGAPRTDMFINATAMTEQNYNPRPAHGFEGGVGYYSQTVDSNGDIDMGIFQINSRYHWDTIKETYDIQYPEQFIANPTIQHDYMGRLIEDYTNHMHRLKKTHGDKLSTENFPLFANHGLLYLMHNAGPDGAEMYIDRVIKGIPTDSDHQYTKNLTRYQSNVAEVQGLENTTPSRGSIAPPPFTEKF